MWTCPECGREFQRKDQDHYCEKAPATIDEYIAAQPEEIQLALHQVRDALKAALPQAKEKISWSMPTYWDKHNIIHFAGFKKHVGLYPGPAAVEQFQAELADYKTSKGTIQLPLNNPMPVSLIAKIARWCAETDNHA